MTEESIFIDWFKKQDNWLQSLYFMIRDKQNISTDDLMEIINCYKTRKFKEQPEFQQQQTASQKIILLKLYDVNGVNKLVPNHSIEFDKNLTVIYGENGTRKTGYSRIIQQVGKYLGESKAIKPNIYNDNIIPNAKIDYQLQDGTTDTLVWSPDSKEQLNIKLFNSSCIHFFTKEKREIDFQSEIFYLCEQLAQQTTKLNNLAIQELKKLETNIHSSIEDNTVMSRLISKILLNGNIKDLEDLEKNIVSFNIEELRNKKLNLEKDSDKLRNQKASEMELKSLNQRIEDIEQIYFQVSNSDFISSKLYKLYIRNENEIQKLKNQSTVDSILERLNISQDIKEPFVDFISLADKLNRQLNHEKDFTKMQNCIFCKQPINDSEYNINNLLNLYNELVTVSKTDILEKYIRENQEIEKSASNIKIKLKSKLESAFIQDYKELSTSLDNLISVVEHFETNNFVQEINLQLERLKKYQDKLKIEKNKLLELNETRDKKIIEIRNELNEINAKIYLIENWKQKKLELDTYLNLYDLKSINNRSISSCQKNIQDNIYKDKFINILNETLYALNAPEEVKFNPVIRNSKMSMTQGFHEICKANQLNEILSEGEQTVVSLAHFIAESKFNNNDHVLFFDDPVNSLDIKRMGDIARNLVELSKEKQVIIFTHNYVLLGYIKAIIDENKELKNYKFYRTDLTNHNNMEYAGRITITDNPNIESYKHYCKNICKIIEKSKNNLVDIFELQQAYGYMRSAIEVFIVKHFLAGVIERYRPNVSVGCLQNIKYEYLQADKDKLINLFNKTSRYIDGHSSALEAKVEPNIVELEKDFHLLPEISKKYLKN